MLTGKQKQFKKELAALLKRYNAILGVRGSCDDAVIVTTFFSHTYATPTIILGDAFDENDA